MTFKAFRVFAEKTPGRLESMEANDLTPGEVLVRVHYSSVNFKDALAGTGRGKILRKFPLNAGIDAAGVVLESRAPDVKVGEKVIVTGCGTGENHDGGYAELLRTSATSVVPLPKGLTLREAMLLGTAGFTAALALHRMIQNGQTPKFGPVLVTGASGGVGSFAVQLFAHAGFEVHALSQKADAVDYLKELGAREVHADLQLGSRPLESVRFGGAVDNVGGRQLAQVLAHVELWGNVAAIGLADSPELHTTVMPFILRGVSLLGVSSNNTERATRLEIWRRLSTEWKPKNLEKILTRTISLADLPNAFDDLLHRRVRGRILVEVRREA